jgi:phenylalanyl-tRNA synthetase beta chain
MEYSLKTLNEKTNLKTIKISEIIDKLNLIGFEVDEIFHESFVTNRFVDNLRFLICIPSDRQELLNEKAFLNELSTIFLIELNHIWEKTKKNYSYLLKEKYSEYYNYEMIAIESDLSYALTFQIEVEITKNYFSPLWIQNKLTNAGLKVNNTIDDLILLSTLEWGQKFNILASNSSTLNSKSLFLKQLENPEEFKSRDGSKYKLGLQDIVLQDSENQVQAVLGIFNTVNEINIKDNLLKNSENKKIVLQSIFYDIYQNDLLLNSLETEISLRYLRTTCLDTFKYSFQRLLTLLEVTLAAKIIPTVYVTHPNQVVLQTKKMLRLSKILIKDVLGIKLIDATIFKEAGLKIVCQTPKDFYFSIPNNRNDLVREIDLIEEYSRFVGYKNFIPLEPEITKQYARDKDGNIKFIKQYFISYGFQEVINNPLNAYKKELKFKNYSYDFNSILIANPLNAELSTMRFSLLKRLVDVFEYNVRLRTPTSFFEIGRVFEKIDHNFKEVEKLGLIFQLEKSKKSTEPNMEWFMVKGFLENFCLHFGYKNIVFERVELAVSDLSDSIYHPRKTIAIKTRKNQTLGVFGEINPNIESLKKLKYSTYIFEGNLENFKDSRMKSPIPVFKEYSKYPSIVKDISILIDKNISFYKLKAKMQRSSDVLKSFVFFDMYYDEKCLNLINIGIRLEFQSGSKTFTTEFIEAEVNTIKNHLHYWFPIMKFY